MTPNTLVVNSVSANPLSIYREFDRKVIENFLNLQDLAFSEGVLSKKSRLLVAMAIDAEHGVLQSARALYACIYSFACTSEKVDEFDGLLIYRKR